MCVLTLLPKADGFLVTSNRDESAKRAWAVAPEICEVNGGEKNTLLKALVAALASAAFKGVFFSALASSSS